MDKGGIIFGRSEILWPPEQMDCQVSAMPGATTLKSTTCGKYRAFSSMSKGGIVKRRRSEWLL